MDQVMSKYTLKFNDPKVELLYQAQSIQKVLKPLYYVLLVLAILVNCAQLAIRATSLSTISLINSGFIVLALLNIIIICTKEKLTQMLMTFLNAYMLLLQINFQDIPTGQEYYTYGASFASMQAGVYFVTDFQFSCPSIIIHIIFRFTVSVYMSNKIDFMLLCLSLVIGSFLISVLYICNRAQRLQFLMMIKEDTITKQLEMLINKPYSKIKYCEDKMVMEIQVAKQLNQFIGYEEEYCEGCNIRNFLRSCKYNGLTIENGIVKKKIPLNQSFTVQYLKKLLRIRICQFNIDNSLILILESVANKTNKMFNIPQKLQRQLQLQFSSCKNTLCSQQFKFGVMSVLMMNQINIRTVNVSKLLLKLIKLNKLDDKIHLYLLNQQNIKIKTYCHLFSIFIIQILNICSEITVDNRSQVEIDLTNFNIGLVMQLTLQRPKQFHRLYSQNFFIQQTAPLLLQSPLSKNLEFFFGKISSFQQTICNA